MRLLFVGPIWEGSTAEHRMAAFSMLPGLSVQVLDSQERVGRPTLQQRIRHRFRWPADQTRLNDRLLHAVADFRPDIIFIDSSRVIHRSTLRRIRDIGRSRISFYSPDDVSARHNSSLQLESCDREWDVFFTTKSFNVPELRDRGVRRPVLVGNAFDPRLHRPLAPEQVGPEYERFDAVFVGTAEGDRLRSLNRVAESGQTVVVYGNGWRRNRVHPRIELRPAVYATGYTAALHTGKVALGFLRKLNRDRVTTRSVEIPAAARPMVAERTEEHDTMFTDGSEYLSFTKDDELIEAIAALIRHDERRMRLASAARQRCICSGYSTVDRAREMLCALLEE